MKRSIWVAVNILCMFAVIAGMTVMLHAAKTGFEGKWKGEIAAGSGLGGGLGGARGGGPAPAAPAAEPTQFMQGRGGGGGARAGGGGFGGRGAVAQKVTLNLKLKDKDTKAAGNITIGDNGATEDVREGIVDGTKLMFSTGKAPAQVWEYTGELKGDEILMERWVSGSGGQTTKFTLKRS